MQRSLITAFRKIPLNKGPINSVLCRANFNRSLVIRWMSSDRHKNPFAEKESTDAAFQDRIKSKLANSKDAASASAIARERPAPPPPRPLFFFRNNR